MKNLLRPEFPSVWSLVSQYVSSFVIIVLLISSVADIVHKSVDILAPFYISTIGLVAGLASICNGLVRSKVCTEDDDEDCDFIRVLSYSAEKFLHCTVLLTQSLLVIYCRDQLLELSWNGLGEQYVMIKTSILRPLLSTISVFTNTCASWAWYYGFSKINLILWSRWESRIDSINNKSTSTEEQKLDI